MTDLFDMPSDVPAALAARIDSEIDALFPQALQVLRRMVQVNSVNPLFPGVARGDVIGGEAVSGRIYADYLTDFGFTLDIVAPDPERPNHVLTRKGRGGGGRSLIVNGHLDTVPPVRPEEWRGGDPWSAELTEDRLYGLGSTDMKGGLVSAALAAAALDRLGIALRGDLQIQAVVGEETGDGALGTDAVLEAGFTADAAIIAEPTSVPGPLSIAPVSVGNFVLKIEVDGFGTHVGNRGSSIRAGGAGCSAGVNAVEKAILVVQSLLQLEQEWGLTKQNPAFPPGVFTITPAYLHADSGVPSVGYLAHRARIGVLVWYPPAVDPAAIRAEIEAQVHHAARQDIWLRDHPPRLIWESNWPAFETAETAAIVRRLVADRAAVLGPVPAGLRATHGFIASCDATYFTQRGIPALAFGPGDLGCAHAVDEHLLLAQLRDAARILARTMIGWCGLASAPPAAG